MVTGSFLSHVFGHQRSLHPLKDHLLGRCPSRLAGWIGSILPYSALRGQPFPVTATPFCSSTGGRHPLGQTVQIGSLIAHSPPIPYSAWSAPCCSAGATGFPWLPSPQRAPPRPRASRESSREALGFYSFIRAQWNTFFPFLITIPWPPQSAQHSRVLGSVIFFSLMLTPPC